MEESIMAQKYNLEHCKITFRNLAGRPTDFNPNGGVRSFAVLLNADMAAQLMDAGFDVKQFVNKETGELGDFYLKVKVNFKSDADTGEFNGPFIYLINENVKDKKTLLLPPQVQIVDRADIDYVDLTITPYLWKAAGRQGISAYLVKMFVKVQEDPLEKKWSMYDDIDDTVEQEEIPFE